MDETQQTKKSGAKGPLAWAAFGVLIGVGIAAIALNRKAGESKPLRESLEDLFRTCEADCQDLESRYSQSSLAS